MSRSSKVFNAVEDAKAIAWDTCHKIYVLMDDEQVQKMREYGYGDDMLTKAELTTWEMMKTLEDWYDNACGLKFIEAVKTVEGNPNEGFKTLIGQGSVWRR